MKVKMTQDQHYIDVSGAKYCALAGDVVDIDEAFSKLIKGKFEPYVEEVKENDEAKVGKALEDMNKDELVANAIMAGIDLDEEDFKKLKKAEIIELILQVK